MKREASWRENPARIARLSGVLAVAASTNLLGREAEILGGSLASVENVQHGMPIAFSNHEPPNSCTFPVRWTMQPLPPSDISAPILVLPLIALPPRGIRRTA
jgi:hypothetical protein